MSRMRESSVTIGETVLFVVDMHTVQLAGVCGMTRGQIPKIGDALPLVVTAVGANNQISGQLFLNGDAMVWVECAGLGTEPGQWQWVGDDMRVTP